MSSEPAGNQGFAANVFKVAGGEALAQALLLASLPVLTRLYTPQEFGAFGIFSAISAIGTIIGAARYELAVPIPEKDSESLALVIASLLIALLLSLVGTAALAFWVPAALNEFWMVFVLLPLHAASNTWINAFRQWLGRKSEFRWLAQTRIIYAVVTLTLHIAFGYFGMGATGLMLGLVIGTFLQLLLTAYRSLKLRPAGIKAPIVRDTMRKFSRFPRFTLFGHALNSFTWHLPVLLSAALFSPEIAGYYSLCMRIMDAPSNFVGRAVQQVYFPEAARRYIGSGSSLALYQKSLLYLFSAAILGFGILAAVGPELIPFILGHEWDEVGMMCRYLAPAYVAQFCHFPLACMLLIAGRQRLDLLWQLFYFSSVLIGFYFGSYLGGWIGSVYGYGIALFCAYSLNLVLSYSCARSEPAGEREKELCAA